MKNQFIYNLTKHQVAERLGITVQTIDSWRESGKLPDYLYRQFGTVQTIRYCELLIDRWQAKWSDGIALAEEERWARSQLIESLAIPSQKRGKKNELLQMQQQSNSVV